MFFYLGQEQRHDVVTDLGRLKLLFQAARVAIFVGKLVLDPVVSAERHFVQFRRFQIGGQCFEGRLTRRQCAATDGVQIAL
ncbi:hypothetical protein D3C77_385960 [compost metagenome]